MVNLVTNPILETCHDKDKVATKHHTTRSINQIIMHKPGPPCFARSTILVISSPNFMKLTLKKFGLAIKITPSKETVPVVHS